MNFKLQFKTVCLWTLKYESFKPLALSLHRLIGQASKNQRELTKKKKRSKTPFLFGHDVKLSVQEQNQ